MELVKIFLIFLGGILDGVIFLAVDSNNILTLFIFHLIVYLIIRRLSKGLSEIFGGIPIYLVFFLPGLGAIINSLLYFSLYYFNRDSIVLADYEQYIDFEKFFEQHRTLDYNKEIGILSSNDQMNLLDTGRKKDLIIEFEQNDYGGKVEVLKKGLIDSDNDVKHYSAVTINMLENELTFNISKLREDYNKYSDINALKKLSKVYQDYLTSGLLNGEVYQVINQEYIEVLLKIKDRKKENLEILDQLVKAYIRSGNLLSAENVNNSINERFSESSEFFINKMNIAYERKNYKEIQEIIKDINEVKLKESAGLTALTSYWT